MVMAGNFPMLYKRGDRMRLATAARRTPAKCDHPTDIAVRVPPAADKYSRSADALDLAPAQWMVRSAARAAGP